MAMIYTGLDWNIFSWDMEQSSSPTAQTDTETASDGKPSGLKLKVFSLQNKRDEHRGHFTINLKCLNMEETSHMGHFCPFNTDPARDNGWNDHWAKSDMLFPGTEDR